MTDHETILTFMLTLDGREKATKIEIRLLFNYHNELYPSINETGVGCGSCVTRVYNRMKNWRTKINEKHEN
jgi:hypothetical protein